MNWRTVRLWALVVVITADLSMITLMAIGHEWFWVSVYGFITGIILAAEIISYLWRRETISTDYGDWIRRQPALAFTSIGLLCLVFLGLAIHLLAYGFK